VIDSITRFYDMPSQLYKFRIQRPGEEITLAHVIAPTEDDATQHFLDREFTLGLAHKWFTSERVDRLLPRDERHGLAPLLKSAPTCMASYNPIAGWFAHVAPVYRLRLYRSIDYRGMEILAAAPNEDVAKELFNTTQFAAVRAQHIWFIEDATDKAADQRPAGLKRMLEGEVIGIAEFDEDEGGWWVW
jgi:hypothetical protein